jgi:hypothetical protein
MNSHPASHDGMLLEISPRPSACRRQAATVPHERDATEQGHTKHAATVPSDKQSGN